MAGVYGLCRTPSTAHMLAELPKSEVAEDGVFEVVVQACKCKPQALGECLELIAERPVSNGVMALLRVPQEEQEREWAPKRDSSVICDGATR